MSARTFLRPHHATPRIKPDSRQKVNSQKHKKKTANRAKDPVAIFGRRTWEPCRSARPALWQCLSQRRPLQRHALPGFALHRLFPARRTNSEPLFSRPWSFSTKPMAMSRVTECVPPRENGGTAAVVNRFASLPRQAFAPKREKVRGKGVCAVFVPTCFRAKFWPCACSYAFFCFSSLAPCLLREAPRVRVWRRRLSCPSLGCRPSCEQRSQLLRVAVIKTADIPACVLIATLDGTQRKKGIRRMGQP